MPVVGDIKKGQELGYQASHSFIWHACIGCGKGRWVQLVRNQPKTARCQPCANGKGETHTTWGGGRTRDTNGYIRIWLSPDNFFYPMAHARGYILEHRFIVAQALNRCLLPWEIVHHKEGFAKDDNRYPETLELISDTRFHLVDAQVRAYIKRLEKKIISLIDENAWLKEKFNVEVRLTK